MLCYQLQVCLSSRIFVFFCFVQYNEISFTLQLNYEPYVSLGIDNQRGLWKVGSNRFRSNISDFLNPSNQSNFSNGISNDIVTKLLNFFADISCNARFEFHEVAYVRVSSIVKNLNIERMHATYASKY